VCAPKHVEQLRNIGIINSTTRLHFIGSFYEIYIMMHDPRTSNSQSNLAKTPLAYGKNVIYILKLNIKN